MIDQTHLEQIYLAIYRQYESVVFDLPPKHQKSCLRLLNAANALYNNALRILRKQDSIILDVNSNQPIALQHNNDTFFRLFEIVSSSSSLPVTLLSVRKLLLSSGLRYLLFL